MALNARTTVRSLFSEVPRPAPPVPPSLEGEDFECVATDVGPLWFPATDDVMRPYLRDTGTWEADEGKLIASLLRPGCRFLDVGANVGYFTLFAVANCPDASIDAVEPHPLTARVLRFNLWANRIDATVWPLALSDGARSVTLTTAATNLGDTRSSASDPSGTVASLVAPAAAGDDLFDGRGFDVVKLDVQGSEWDVVSGMVGTIRRSPGISIVAEFWPTALVERGDDPREVLSRYRRLGLTVVTQVASRLERLDDAEIMRVCHQAGRDGQVNLLLTDR